MDAILTWTKGLFESNYQIFSNGRIKNSLLFNTWRNEAQGIGTDQNYSFRTAGFLHPTTTIFNQQMEPIGTITYNSWQTKAMLQMQSGEQFMWNFTNGWYSKWTIGNFQDKQILFDSNSSNGVISTNTDDEVLLLAGLFIREYHSRLFIFLLLLIFIPIILH